MSDIFNQRGGIPVIGTSAAPITLTASYNATNSGIFNVGTTRFISLGVAYSMANAETANSIELKFEVSNDKTTWYRMQTEAASSGTVTRTYREDTFSAVAAALSYDYFTVDFENFAWKYLQVSVKETGINLLGGSCYIVGTFIGI